MTDKYIYDVSIFLQHNKINYSMRWSVTIKTKNTNSYSYAFISFGRRYYIYKFGIEHCRLNHSNKLKYSIIMCRFNHLDF